MENGIYLVATPIGNTGDITLRALEVLQKADLIACEDTRVSKKLCALLNIATKGKTFIAVHDHNESELAQKVIDEAAAGKIVVYMSDAGSPLISDPGYKLAKAAREQGVYLTTLPGACAAICALQLSGLPSNAFMFCGFIPNKEKARIDFLKKNSQVDATLIFYERADRLVKSLIVMQNIFAQREIAVAREITKLHETCCNGTATELVAYFEQNPPKGEIVLMVAPPDDSQAEPADYSDELRRELEHNNLKTAVKTIVEKYNLNRNEVYKKALELKDNG